MNSLQVPDPNRAMKEKNWNSSSLLGYIPLLSPRLVSIAESRVIAFWVKIFHHHHHIH